MRLRCRFYLADARKKGWFPLSRRLSRPSLARASSHPLSAASTPSPRASSVHPISPIPTHTPLDLASSLPDMIPVPPRTLSCITVLAKSHFCYNNCILRLQRFIKIYLPLSLDWMERRRERRGMCAEWLVGTGHTAPRPQFAGEHLAGAGLRTASSTCQPSIRSFSSCSSRLDNYSRQASDARDPSRQRCQDDVVLFK